MASRDLRFAKFTSALYGAAKELAIAVATAPDAAAGEHLAHLESGVRYELRRQRLPSPEEPRIFFREPNEGR